MQPGEYYRKDTGKYQYKVSNKDGWLTFSAETLDELRQKEAAMQVAMGQGLDVLGANATVDELFERWHDIKRDIAPTTRDTYVKAYQRYAQPEIGQMRIGDVTKSRLQKLYIDIIEGSGLSLSTAVVADHALYQVFQLAADDKLIASNPAKGALKELKGQYSDTVKHVEALTVEQEAQLIQELSKPSHAMLRPLYMLMLCSGLRVGEALGLTWDDIDEAQGVLHVRRNLVYRDKSGGMSGHFVVHAGKTQQSVRDIPLTDGIRAALNEQKAQWAGCVDKVPMESKRGLDGGTVTGFIFTSSTGRVRHPSTIGERLTAIARASNADPDAVRLPEPFGTHILRHTFVTRMIESGASPTAVAAIAGHKDVNVTLGVYNTVTANEKAKAMRMGDDLRENILSASDEKHDEKVDTEALEALPNEHTESSSGNISGNNDLDFNLDYELAMRRREE